MNRPTFTPQDVLAALRTGKCRDFTDDDFMAFGGAPEGSVAIDEVWFGWMVIVGGAFQIEAHNNDGEGYMLLDGVWAPI